MRHELKCWPEFFEAIRLNKKRFEVRKDDRDFQADDELYLREWDADSAVPHYTGREMMVDVLYVLRDAGGDLLPPGTCIMSVRPWLVGHGLIEILQRKKA